MNFDQFWNAIFVLGASGGRVDGLHFWIVRRKFKNGNVRETLFIQSDTAKPNKPWGVTRDTANGYFGIIQRGAKTKEQFAYDHGIWFYLVCTHYLSSPLIVQAPNILTMNRTYPSGRVKEVESFFLEDRRLVLAAAEGFSAEAWKALLDSTQLDPAEDGLRLQLCVTCGGHHTAGITGAPPSLLAMAQSPSDRSLSERELVDEYYKRRRIQEELTVDVLGSYQMNLGTGPTITLKWDTLRLASIDLAAEAHIPERCALEALAQSVYLHELAHYFTHWGRNKSADAEETMVPAWRNFYQNFGGDGVTCLKEGLTELACATVFETNPAGDLWTSVRDATSWVNGNLTGRMKERYVDSMEHIRLVWGGKLSSGEDNFWTHPSLFVEDHWDGNRMAFSAWQKCSIHWMVSTAVAADWNYLLRYGLDLPKIQYFLNKDNPGLATDF